MSNRTRTLWINTPLKGPLIDEFLAVKEYLGIEANTDIVRYLIRRQARVIRQARDPDPGRLAFDAHAPGPESPDTPLADAELCLSCSLPDCDENDPGCAYQRATGERDRRRARMRTYMRRKRAAEADGEGG